MLNKLIIKNVALIESAVIDFSNGFNVLSGETGSGKSVILESINFVLGAKADKNLIRTGASECLVSAEFRSENNEVAEILDSFGIEKEEILLITRKFNLNGKNTVTVNGNPATVSMVKKLTSALIDVHGQSEHFYLLTTSNQLKLLDKFSEIINSDLAESLRTLYSEYKNLNKELSLSGGDESSRLLRLDVLNYQIREIQSADVKENEFEELSEIKSKLLYKEKIMNALSSVNSGIEGEGGISDILSNCVKVIGSIANLGENYNELFTRLNDAYAEIDDILSATTSLSDDLGDEEYSLDEVDARLSLVKTLFKKYGGDYNSLMEFYDNAVKEREKLENFNEYAKNLQNKIIDVKKKLYDLYVDLSKKRKVAAEKFEENVVSELRELGMSKARFKVEFNDVPTFDECKFDSEKGFDTIRFTFSANAGEPLKPLSEVISGGEMSRFMLAIKAQTAKYNEISTFIFDEIDAGISGSIAWTVAEKLLKISLSVQVIAVSHLPQIVSFADNNVLITKTETEDKTLTTAKSLDEDGKLAEIIRLSGGINEETSFEHAKSLLIKADNFKNSL